jgi:hypothetical protein
MNRYLSRSVALCAALLLPVMASASADMFLQIKGATGETRVVACTAGACVVEGLAIGQYSALVCDEQGKVVPSNMVLDYTIIGPRDAASGLATGKRMHKPFTITMELGRTAAAANTIAIDAAGTRLVIGVNSAAVDAAVAKIGKSRSNIQNN